MYWGNSGTTDGFARCNLGSGGFSIGRKTFGTMRDN
jgi:hypothetical protein